MTIENDLILQNPAEESDGMLPPTSCFLPSSSGISSLLAVAFGGGTNSTAMLCGFRERGIKPDLITFADTGGESPHTYEHVLEMDLQCRVWWGIGIETVRQLFEGEFEGLESECIRGKKLPSLAYGSKACSMKYKIQPQTVALKQWMDAMDAREVTRAIGYDAGESHRAVDITGEDLKSGRTAHNWFPLIEWNWRRVDCIAAIKRHGLTQPGKSSCFFCPAMKRGEILRLKDEQPELFARAVAMESNAITTRNMGLTGRSLRWADIGAQDDRQARLWDFLDEKDESETPCGCYDG
jgi:hypothetical protein